MSTKVILANGVSLFTESFGDKNDPAILLIMGATASAAWWPAQFCQGLADRGRFVIRYDHRDTGASTTYPVGEQQYDVEDLADDAIHVLDDYGVESAHLMGMSLGGYLGQLMALKYPARVRSLTLVSSERLAEADPTMPPMDPSILAYHGKMDEVDWADRDEVVEFQVGMRRLLSGPAHEFAEAEVRAMASEEFARAQDMQASFNHGALQGGDAWLGRLNEISAATLIIHGSDDPVLPHAHALALKDAICNASLMTLQGTGHELHRNDWPAIIDAVVKHTSQ